jgi:hypothetical protein
MIISTGRPKVGTLARAAERGLPQRDRQGQHPNPPNTRIGDTRGHRPTQRTGRFRSIRYGEGLQESTPRRFGESGENTVRFSLYNSRIRRSEDCRFRWESLVEKTLVFDL